MNQKRLKKMITHCDECPKAYTEYCLACAYSNSHGEPNMSDWDPDDFDEDSEDKEED